MSDCRTCERCERDGCTQCCDCGRDTGNSFHLPPGSIEKLFPDIQAQGVPKMYASMFKRITALEAVANTAREVINACWDYEATEATNALWDALRALDGEGGNE